MPPKTRDASTGHRLRLRSFLKARTFSRDSDGVGLDACHVLFPRRLVWAQRDPPYASGTTFADVPGTGGYVASKVALERLSAIARAELAGTGVVVSTLIPFATETEFMASIRAGRAEAEAMTAGATFDTPETVADAVLALIESGAARMDLVPAAYGGSR